MIFPSDSSLIEEINSLYSEYHIKEKVGICFKLQKGKSPLEILGVLEVLKYKLKIWGNTNLFYYQGKFFDDDFILVVGSNNLQEAQDIVIFIFLKEILDKGKDIFYVLNDLEDFNDLKDHLSREISKNLVSGYPNDLNLEKEIINHIKELIND